MLGGKRRWLTIMLVAGTVMIIGERRCFHGHGTDPA